MSAISNLNPRTRSFNVGSRESLVDLPRPSSSLAIATISAAVACSCFILPEDCGAPGALFNVAFIMCLGLTAPVAIAASKDVRAVLLPESVLGMAPIYWLLLDLLAGRYGITLASRRDVTIAIVAVGLFSIAGWYACSRRPPFPRLRILERLDPMIPTSSLFSAGCMAFLLGIVYFVAKAGLRFDLIIEGLMGSRFQAVWARKVAKGDWWAVVEHMTYFGMLLPPIVVLVAHRLGAFSFQSIVLTAFTLIYGMFQAQMGNRRYIGVMFGAGIVVWLLRTKRAGMGTFMKLAFATVMMITLLEYMFVYRIHGAKILQDSELRSKHVQFNFIRVDDNFLRLAQTAALVPSRAPYAYHEYVWFAIIRPIPRVIWPGKPVSPGFRLHDFVRIGASLSSSIVGEGYASYGLVGVLLFGFAYGTIASQLRILLTESTNDSFLGLYGIGLLALFAGVRSMMDLVAMSYVFLAALVVLTWVSKRRAANKSSKPMRNVTSRR